MTETLKPFVPKYAVDFFRKKGYQVGFNWQDVWEEEHAYSFTVAKAMRNDILQDIRTAVDEAIEKGVPFQQFAAGLEPTLADKGWWGRKMMVDPLTGEEKLVMLGSPGRLRTIYHVNVRSAHAAGRWQQIERNKKNRPYLRYVAVMDSRTRDQHRAWHGIILPIDHPFWETHYPPCGYNCRCRTRSVSERDMKRKGWALTDEKSIPTQTRTFLNKRTGELTKIPDGITPGFAWNVGKARMKAMIPPPLDRPSNIPFMGDPAKVGMPAARPMGKNMLYTAGLLEAQYAKQFLREFDKSGKPMVFKDVTGEALVISDDLFKTASGRYKISRGMRAEYMGLMAKTIQDPDEIWHVWEEYPEGRWTLRRKYLARYVIEGQTVPVFILFDTGKDGWSGVTAFDAKPTYLDRQRAGSLVYRRADKK